MKLTTYPQYAHGTALEPSAYHAVNRPGFVHTSQVGKDGTMSIKYDPELKAKAVRLFQDHVTEYPSRWAAMKAISASLGMTAETLRQWIKRSEVDAGQAPGLTSDSAAELAAMRRKCRELEQTVEVLLAATGFFARAYDPLRR